MTILLINNNLYEINETNVDVYDISTGECTATQQTLNQLFNLPIETFDAALNWGNGNIYFFKEDKYYKYDIANNECAAGYPLPIADNWKGIADNVWACVCRQDKAYFFNEKQYTRYDCEGDTADENYPLIISENWKDIPETITGIIMLNDATALIQNNSDYYLYDWENDAVINTNGNQLSNTLQQFVSNGSTTPTITNLDWFTVLSNKSNYSSTEINTVISTITANRAAVKTYVKTTPGGYVYFGSASSKPTSIVANTVEDWVWDEIKGEGNFSSMNAYDNMIVTWGKGIAGANITGVLKNIFAKSAAIKNEVFNVGISIDNVL